MAQSAPNSGLPGLDPFWKSASSAEAPTPWRIWRPQFKMSLFAKTNVNFKALEKHPFDGIAPPALTDAPTAGETPAQRTTRLNANKAAQDAYDDACKTALAAPCCSDTLENADLKAISYLYASLGEEGKRRLHQRLPEICPADMFMCDFVQELDNIFHKQRNILVERVKFLSRRQLPNETMQDYFAALTELAAKCEFEHQLAPTWIQDVSSLTSGTWNSNVNS